MWQKINKHTHGVSVQYFWGKSCRRQPNRGEEVQQKIKKSWSRTKPRTWKSVVAVASWKTRAGAAAGLPLATEHRTGELLVILFSSHVNSPLYANTIIWPSLRTPTQLDDVEGGQQWVLDGLFFFGWRVGEIFRHRTLDMVRSLDKSPIANAEF